MNRIPTALHTASVPPTVVAPRARCTTAAARSRGPSLRADVSKRSSSSRVRPTRISPSSPLGGEPDFDALARREAVRDERRLERDDAAAVALCLLDLLRDDDHGIAPSCAQQRAAAFSPSSGPPIRKPAASASPAPVVSTTSVEAAG